jgi:hypothetical protein
MIRVTVMVRTTVMVMFCNTAMVVIRVTVLVMIRVRSKVMDRQRHPGAVEGYSWATKAQLETWSLIL